MMISIERNFSRYARLYDKYAKVQSMAAMELIGRLVGKEYRRILDIGCGTGNYTYLLQNKFRDATITALDISRDMIDVAREKCSNRRMEFIVADAEKASLPERFDLITSNAAFQWFSDLDAAIEKYRDRLLPRGRMLFSTFGPLTYIELGESLKEVLGGAAVISAGNFVNKDELLFIFSKYFRKSAVEEKVIKEEHVSLRQLLNHIKYTGTRGSGVEGLPSGGRTVFSRIEEAYRLRFGRIDVSYQIFFCEGWL